METQQIKELKIKLLKRYNLYKLHDSKIKRIMEDPIRTIYYFIIESFAFIHPFKVNYKTLWGDKMRFYLPEGNGIYYYGFCFEEEISEMIEMINKEAKKAKKKIKIFKVKKAGEIGSYRYRIRVDLKII